MFVRWTHNEITGRPGRMQMGPIPGMESHTAWLVRSVRDGKKVTQKRIAALGTYHTKHGQITDRYATEFWTYARRVLDDLDLTDHDHQKLLASIEGVLPEPRLRRGRWMCDQG